MTLGELHEELTEILLKDLSRKDDTVMISTEFGLMPVSWVESDLIHMGWIKLLAD